MAINREPFEATIDALAHDGRGIARVNGKTVFIEDALPGERVMARLVKKRRGFDEARLEAILLASPDRTTPGCAYFGICGGCSLQHLPVEAQLAHKKSVLAENLQRIGKVKPSEWLESLQGEQWGYRRRARLGVKFVHKKQRVLVGFRERRKPYIAEIDNCDVLIPAVGKLIRALATMVGTLSIRDRIPQIEVAAGDNATALVFRVLSEPSTDDLELLRKFSRQHRFQIYLQSGGLDSIFALDKQDAPLAYTVFATGTRFEFGPSDFIQVNAEINNKIVKRVLEHFMLTCEHKVLDLFCGLGNFSLPLATIAKNVVGIEGDGALINGAKNNAKRNGIENANFFVANLFEDFSDFSWARQSYSAVLLDPPRAGAELVCRHIGQFKAERIIYVSCHPATLARDAGILVNEVGYRLTSAGIMDMFPHTSHVESMAIFDKQA